MFVDPNVEALRCAFLVWEWKHAARMSQRAAEHNQRANRFPSAFRRGPSVYRWRPSVVLSDGIV